jgi:hypothetical protein
VTDYAGIAQRTGGLIDPLPVRCSYSITNTSGTPSTRNYKVSFSLLDAADASVGGATTVAFSVTVPGAVGGEYPVVAGARTASLRPNLLTDGAPYRLSAQLAVQNPVDGTYGPMGGPAVSGEYRWRVADTGTPVGVVGWLNLAAMVRSHAIATAPGAEAFQVRVQGVLGRLDELAQPVADGSFQLHFDSTITGALSGPVALVSPRTTVPAALPNHTDTGGPASLPLDQTLDLQPAVQLDSMDTFTVAVALSVTGPDNVEVPTHSTTLAPGRLLHFNGSLLFGAVAARLDEVSNTPAPLGPAPGGGERTQLLLLPPNGASLVASPGHKVSAAAALDVVLRADGTAESAAAADVTPPAVPDIGSIHGVRFTRENITLGAAGASATLRVRFPAGFGLTTSASSRRLRPDFPLGVAPLDGGLLPSGSFGLDPATLGAASLFATHEQLPACFATTLIVWDTAAGTFDLRREEINGTRYVRAAELAVLEALRNFLTDPTAADRPSNEAVFRRPDGSTLEHVMVSADEQGRAILTAARLDLPAAEFTAHFPRGVTVGWNAPGALVIQDGQIDPAQSVLPGATEAVFTGSPNCARHSPGVAPDSQFTFMPAARVWTFTPDGGLHAEGSLAAAPLRWGTRDATHFVHTTGDFTSAAARVPGQCLRGALATTDADNRPGELLLSGQGRPGDAAYAEHPRTEGYDATGAADYAGLNFRVDADGAQTAITVLGNCNSARTLGPYDLRGSCKYYARPAGVSGIHEAVTASFAAAAGDLRIYGFPMVFDNLQVSYLDNENHESLISGTVTVPGVRATPGFTQPFTNLALRCNGDLGELTLPNPNNIVHTLHYWRASFQARSAEFMAKPCGDPRAALVFGADVKVAGVLKDPVTGALGFKPDGNLVTAADGFPGVESRLRLPGGIGLHGTGSLNDAARPAFTVHPASGLYFNNALDPDAPDAGFVSFAGTVDVPFFEDIKVHVLARATGTVVRGGWTDGGQTFFTSTRFDPTNRGFPPGPFLDYMAAAWHPQVHKEWLGLVDFDMPVIWDAARRQFVSPEAPAPPGSGLPHREHAAGDPEAHPVARRTAFRHAVRQPAAGEPGRIDDRRGRGGQRTDPAHPPGRGHRGSGQGPRRPVERAQRRAGQRRGRRRGGRVPRSAVRRPRRPAGPLGADCRQLRRRQCPRSDGQPEGRSLPDYRSTGSRHHGDRQSPGCARQAQGRPGGGGPAAEEGREWSVAGCGRRQAPFLP